jgi:hypothetical protein
VATHREDGWPLEEGLGDRAGEGILTAKEGIIEDVVSARLRPARRKSARPMRVIAVAVAATLG